MLVARSELSYYPEAELELQQKQSRPRKKINKKRKLKQNKVNSSVKLMYIFMAIIFLGVCLLILTRYADITSVRTSITQLEREKVELEKIKLDLIGELEGIKSSGQIAEDAILKLGMDYPTDGQTAYITVKDKSMDNIIEKLSIKEQIERVLSQVASLF